MKPAKRVKERVNAIPATNDLQEVANASKGCRGCDLWRNATQTVFGEGPAHARIIFIGEQPGDKEDEQGEPFVGPAGRVLDESLVAAGIEREKVYLTNAVKHFKWEASGNRRLHKKPDRSEISACRPWLDAELRIIKPDAIVCLGATAAQSILGSAFKLSEHRGEFIPSALAPLLLATVHPSYLLRIPDQQRRHEERERFVADLRLVAAHVRALDEIG